MPGYLLTSSTNIFAPGSTLKPITIAADLEKGGQNSLSTYVVPDQITVHGERYHDAEPHPTLKYTIAGILANSLNDGMVQIVQRITPQQQTQIDGKVFPSGYDRLARDYNAATTTGARTRQRRIPNFIPDSQFREPRPPTGSDN